MIHWLPAPDLDRLRQRLDYNPITGIFVWREGTFKGKITGCLNPKTGYLGIGFDKKFYRAHRLAWFYVYGTWPKNDIDHVDGVRTHNWISNLREATRSQNCCNRKKRAKKNLPLGVYVRKRTNKITVIKKPYYSMIRASRNRNKFLGSYATIDEAAAAYAAASKELYKNFSPFLG